MHVGENGRWRRCAPSLRDWPELWAVDKAGRNVQQLEYIRVITVFCLLKEELF